MLNVQSKALHSLNNYTGHLKLPVDLFIGQQWTALDVNLCDCMNVMCNAGKEDECSANFPWVNNGLKINRGWPGWFSG